MLNDLLLSADVAQLGVEPALKGPKIMGFVMSTSHSHTLYAFAGCLQRWDRAV